MPSRTTTSIVVGLVHVNDSHAQGVGSPSRPTRVSLSHTRSVTQEPMTSIRTGLM